MAASSGSAAAKPTPGPAWYLPPLGADMSADAWSVAGVGSPASGFYAPPQAPGVATPSGAAPYYSALALEAQARWAAAGGLPPAYGAAAYGLPGSVPPGYAPPAMIPGAAHNYWSTNPGQYRFREMRSESETEGGATSGASAEEASKLEEAAASAASSDPTASEAARLARAHGLNPLHWSDFAAAPPPEVKAPPTAPSAYTARQRAHRLGEMQRSLERKMSALKDLHREAALAGGIAGEGTAAEAR